MKKVVAALLGLVVLLGPVVSTTVYADKPDKAGKQLPKGLQKKLARGGELPPGWQKKLQPGAVLPAEIRDAGEPVSDEIAEAVEAAQAEDEIAAEVIRIQDKVVRVSKGEGTVLDIIDLADIATGGKVRKPDSQ